jgi:hypothetical protein
MPQSKYLWIVNMGWGMNLTLRWGWLCARGQIVFRSQCRSHSTSGVSGYFMGSLSSEVGDVCGMQCTQGPRPEVGATWSCSALDYCEFTELW